MMTNEIVVMIVDDDDAALRSVVRALDYESDFTVLAAVSHQQAAEMASANRVDVTIIDGLYGDGVKLAGHLMATGLGGNLVAYSSDDEAQQAMLEAGCVVGLKKPFRLGDMISLIRTLAASP